MVVQDASLVAHDHVFVSIQNVHNTNLVSRHSRAREEVTRWVSISFNDNNLARRSRNGRSVGDVTSVALKWVVSKEFFEVGWVFRRTVSRLDTVDTDTWFVSQSGVARLLFNKCCNGSISKDGETL